MRCQTLLCGFCGVLVLLNTLIKREGASPVTAGALCTSPGYRCARVGCILAQTLGAGTCFWNCIEIIPVVCCSQSEIHEISGVKKLL